MAESTSVRPEQIATLLMNAESTPLPHAMRVAEIAKRQNVSLAALFEATGVGASLEREALITTELELKYAGYFERERVQAEKMKRMGDFPLPSALPYAELRSLSTEARQKLAELRPRTLAQASRVPGVSPNDLQNLVLEIERRRLMASDVAP